MKDMFPGFYAPSEDELTSLWKEGVFILDASVLLQLYALPERTRNETFEVLQRLQARLWVPHQAALEFQRNRPRVIGAARAAANQSLEPMQAALNAFTDAVRSMRLDERGHQDALTLLQEVSQTGGRIIEAAKAAVASHVDIDGADPVRDKLDELLAGRIGDPPDAKTLDSWNREAEERFRHRMGPGYLDEGKMKNPTYMVGGLVFDKRYGDFVLWQQTISHVTEQNIGGVVLVTNDRKGDWWRITDHGVAGPLPELCEEIRRKAKLNRFWMYDLENFLRVAARRISVTVSNTTFEDVAESNANSAADAEVVIHAGGHVSPVSQSRPRGLAGLVRMKDELKRVLLSRSFLVVDSQPSLAVGYVPSMNGARLGIAVAATRFREGFAGEVRDALESMTAMVGSVSAINIYVRSFGESSGAREEDVSRLILANLTESGISNLSLTIRFGVGALYRTILDAQLDG